MSCESFMTVTKIVKSNTAFACGILQPTFPKRRIITHVEANLKKKSINVAIRPRLSQENICGFLTIFQFINGNITMKIPPLHHIDN